MPTFGNWQSSLWIARSYAVHVTVCGFAFRGLVLPCFPSIIPESPYRVWRGVISQGKHHLNFRPLLRVAFVLRPDITACRPIHGMTIVSEVCARKHPSCRPIRCTEGAHLLPHFLIWRGEGKCKVRCFSSFIRPCVGRRWSSLSVRK